MPNSSRITGNEPAEAADPGDTRSTKPGNPDKSGPSKPEEVTDTQSVASGDRNVGGTDRIRALRICLGMWRIAWGRPMHFTINGRAYAADVDVRTSILDLCREHLGLTGAKKD